MGITDSLKGTDTVLGIVIKIITILGATAGVATVVLGSLSSSLAEFYRQFGMPGAIIIGLTLYVLILIAITLLMRNADGGRITVAYLLLGICVISGVASVFLFLQTKAAADPPQTIPHADFSRIDFFKDPNLYLDGSSSDPILTFTALPTTNTNLSIFVEYSRLNFPTRFWEPKQRTFIQDIKIYKNQQIRIPIFVRSNIAGTSTDQWWGPPNDLRGNGVTPGPTLAAIVFLDSQGKESYLPFLVVQQTRGDPRFHLLRAEDIAFIQKWVSEGN